MQDIDVHSESKNLLITNKVTTQIQKSTIHQYLAYMDAGKGREQDTVALHVFSAPN